MQVAIDATTTFPWNLHLDRYLVAIALNDEFLDVTTQLTGHFNLSAGPAADRDFTGNIGYVHMAVSRRIDCPVNLFGYYGQRYQCAQQNSSQSFHHASLFLIQSTMRRLDIVSR